MLSLARPGIALALSTLLLAGCSGGQDESQADTSSPSATTSDYLEVPDGVELTEQGADLEFGKPATVAFAPRQQVVGVVDLTVTRVDRGDIRDFAAFKLDAASRTSTPFYVRTSVKNVGTTNLSDAMLPLYVSSGDNHLLSASRFTSAFKPCPSTPLPKTFTSGKESAGCLVYLVPKGGSFEGVSFYPQDGFDPITWTGEVTKPAPRKPKAPKKR